MDVRYFEHCILGRRGNGTTHGVELTEVRYEEDEVSDSSTMHAVRCLLPATR